MNGDRPRTHHYPVTMFLVMYSCIRYMAAMRLVHIYVYMLDISSLFYMAWVWLPSGLFSYMSYIWPHHHFFIYVDMATRRLCFHIWVIYGHIITYLHLLDHVPGSLSCEWEFFMNLQLSELQPVSARSDYNSLLTCPAIYGVSHAPFLTLHSVGWIYNQGPPIYIY